jgi:hypothetical protein
MYEPLKEDENIIGSALQELKLKQSLGKYTLNSKNCIYILFKDPNSSKKLALTVETKDKYYPRETGVHNLVMKEVVMGGEKDKILQ